MVRDPLASKRNDCGRRALGHRELVRRARVAEAIVVQIEALIQAESRVDGERTDERRGRVAGLLEQRPGGSRAGGQPIAAVVANAMLKRIRAGEDARM